MTLLESIVALVIVSLAAVGFLNVFESDARLPGAAKEWTSAVAFAEEGIELVKLGQVVSPKNSAGLSRQITKSPFARHVDEVRVTVTLDGGKVFELRRLVSAR